MWFSSDAVLAVIANPLSQTEFTHLLKAASIEPPMCAGEPDRAYMDQEQAHAILAWLNQQSHQAFALLTAVIATELLLA